MEKDQPDPAFYVFPVANLPAASSTSSTGLARTVVVYPLKPDPGWHPAESSTAPPPAHTPTWLPVREHELALEWIIAAPSLAAIAAVIAKRVVSERAQGNRLAIERRRGRPPPAAPRGVGRTPQARGP